MKLALIGYGKMGKIIEQIALSQGHTIGAVVDLFAADTAVSGLSISKSIADACFDSVDAAIEFTQPAAAAENIIALAERKIPVVSGTTGWYGLLGEVTKIVEREQSALMWASNFSIGVNLFYRIAWHAAELFNKFPEYDAGGFEAHHNKKLDSPSGTAKTLAEGVISRIDRKNKIVWERMKGSPEADELHFPSLRIGSVPGAHSLFFDSPADTIEITHTARSREGFAGGALKAAQWLIMGKKRGVFTIDDMLEAI
ncbi:MAG: 4-hydroxy-tetrahydrodipicolinate reductase [Treponema sp.]|jgi:4-hydroxy-tetrahydrodipicolinate reductase|nr:4-hydroxy-tetrahydrodipicolinate reductase [Treponema sp.]